LEVADATLRSETHFAWLAVQELLAASLVELRAESSAASKACWPVHQGFDLAAACALAVASFAGIASAGLLIQKAAPGLGSFEKQPSGFQS